MGPSVLRRWSNAALKPKAGARMSVTPTRDASPTPGGYAYSRYSDDTPMTTMSSMMTAGPPAASARRQVLALCGSDGVIVYYLQQTNYRLHCMYMQPGFGANAQPPHARDGNAH